MPVKTLIQTLALAILLVGALVACGKKDEAGAPASTAKQTFTLGYFPNVTHAQALVGIQRGDFAKALGPDVEFKSIAFNAGPSVIESVYAGHLDMAYVGPSPIINGFLKSSGKEVRVVAGSALNGILIVGSKKRGITTLEQLKGGKVATPQIANTQDISAKHYVTTKLGSKLGHGDGATNVIPITNPDIMNLFEKDQLDGAWVPEPWGSRMIQEGLVVLIAEEKDLWESKQFMLTGVIARAEFLEKHPELVTKMLQAHVQLTKDLAANGPAFIPQINAQIEAATGKKLPESVLASSLYYTIFTTDPDVPSLQRFFEKGRDLKFYTQPTFNVEQLVDTRLLKAVESAAPAAP